MPTLQKQKSPPAAKAKKKATKSKTTTVAKGSRKKTTVTKGGSKKGTTKNNEKVMINIKQEEINLTTCTHCNKTFTTEAGLLYHMEKKVCQKTKDDKEFPCKHCNKIFTTEKRLSNHIEKKVCQRKSKGEVDTSSSSSSEKEEEEEAPVPTTPNGRPIRKRRKTSNFTPAAAATTANDDDDDSVVSSAADSDEDDNFKPPPNEEGEDSAESDEDFDFDEDDTKKKKKKKKKKKGTTTTKKKKRQSAPASLKSSNNNNNKANKKFGKLKSGTKFITNYGIVEVISDNRIPTDYNNKSTIDEQASRNFHKRKQRYNDRYQLMEDSIACGVRYRREELKKIYVTSKQHGGGGGTNNIQQQQQQKQVWELYCKSFTTNQILNEGLSARKLNVKGSNEIESVKESFDNVDPRYPKDRYPNRIVECKLVEDTREVVIGSVNEDVSSDGCGDAAVAEYHVKEEEVKSKRKVVPMRLYIARKDLIKEFGSSDTNYVCNNCGKDYPFREGLKYHLTTRACGTVKKSAEKKERDDRIVSIENKALSSGNDSNAAAAARNTLLTSLHGALKIQERVSLQKRPAGFGNPHKIKEFKKHKMPPWLVFNDDRSSMYPEIYVTLGFKRGSQNRNWATKKRLDDGYVPRWEQKRDYKKRKRMSLDHHHTDTKPTPVLSTQVTTAGSALAATTTKPPSIPKSKSTQKKKPSTKQQKKKQPAKEKKDHHPLELPSEPPALPPLPTIANPDDVVMDVDFGGSGNDDLIFETSDLMLTEEVPNVSEEGPKKMAAAMLKKAATPPPPAPKPPAAVVAPPAKKSNVAPQDSVLMPPPASKKKDATKAPPAVTTKGGNNKRKATTAASTSSSTTTTNKKSRKKGITINKKKDCVVIDTQVLATECESGRYPTINRYYGLHEAQCTICKKDDDETPLIHCDFCKNSCHQLCIDKRMLLKDPQVIIRENEPDDTPMCNECISTCLFRRWRAESRRITKWQHELAKAGLGNVPEAAGLTEEVNLKGGKGTNDVQTEEDDTPTYKPCPDGGPGGLICCSYCTASYSRFLSNTAKEMEAQSVSRVGQEVSEILELLADAKQRLQRASDVSQSNDDRRGLLDTNQSAHGGLSLDS